MRIVSLRPLWSSSIHQLEAAATTASKDLNSAHLIVKGLLVCCSRRLLTIPNYSLEELNAFVQKHTPPLTPLFPQQLMQVN